MARWHLRYGRWWMLQWSWNGWLSLGVHVDFRRRPVGEGKTYGPYIDIHVGPAILSVGNNPVYTSDLEMHVSVCRGGIAAGEVPGANNRLRSSDCQNC